MTEEKDPQPNKHYYEAVERGVNAKAEPTVEDALAAMSDLGNDAYHFAFGARRDTPFKNRLAQFHEISHLAPRTGHTIQQENFQSLFQMGLTRGVGLGSLDAFNALLLRNEIDATERHHASIAKSWGEKVCDPTSKTDRAIYVAAGMYLRAKIDAFMDANMLQQPYAEQRRFCEDYAKNNPKPDLTLHHHEKDWRDIGNAPYALIRLSPEEWKGIEAVALGIWKPEEAVVTKETVAVEALKAVKIALVATGLFHDRPASIAARIARQQAESTATTTQR